MTSQVATDRQTAPWRFTRDEAELVLAGLRMLRNYHRYSFHDVNETGPEVQAVVNGLIERLQAELRERPEK
jgi:hypothetical protein